MKFFKNKLVIICAITFCLFLIIFIIKLNAVKQLNNKIPDDVYWKHGYTKLTTPPVGFKTGVAWLQAIYDQKSKDKALVDIDWLRLYARVGDKDTLIASDEYNNNQACGGLWDRTPWFGNVDGTTEGKSTTMPQTFNNGSLILEINKSTDKIWHWWNCSRAIIPENASRVWMEARVKITGPALVQAGIDYWKAIDTTYAGKEINNKEAAVSNWYVENKDWQIISILKPF